MAQLSETQLAWRGRIEAGIRLAQPFLDLLLAAGERLSRAVEREDLEYVPPRSAVRGEARRAVGPGDRLADD